jgi:hypothetical protein
MKQYKPETFMGETIYFVTEYVNLKRMPEFRKHDHYDERTMLGKYKSFQQGFRKKVIAYLRNIDRDVPIGEGKTKEEALKMAKRAIHDPFKYGYGGPY